MFIRPFAWRFLAPTVLVSLALVGACVYGSLYLKRLHDNVSRELSENVQSTTAARSLQAGTNALITLLKGSHDEPQRLEKELREENRTTVEAAETAKRLANLDREKDLVRQIEDGLGRYQQRFTERTKHPPAERPELDRALAKLLTEDVLAPCTELRIYNEGQIERSDRENLAIVESLNWGLLAVAIGAPIGGLLLGYAMARSLRHSIYQLSVGIRDAAGRLNRELGSVTVEEEGDFADLHRQLRGVVAEIERVVAQLQQREREVLRAEQLAAVGQVAAGVAHEMRNPLTSVKMLVQTGLEGQPPPGLPPDDLTIIEHEVRRMEQCIQMFLDFARPPRAERRETDLIPVLRRSLALVEGRARRQKVTVLADLPGEPVFLWIDPEQIHQVLVNLLLNALDALPRGGTVQVTLVRRFGDAGDQVEVGVRDSGPGIAPRIRERLFEPFNSSKETGVGLGLSICRRIVEDHGGTIVGDNLPEGGTRFRFVLPAAAHERTQEPRHAALAGRG